MGGTPIHGMPASIKCNMSVISVKGSLVVVMVDRILPSLFFARTLFPFLRKHDGGCIGGELSFYTQYIR